MSARSTTLAPPPEPGEESRSPGLGPPGPGLAGGLRLELLIEDSAWSEILPLNEEGEPAAALGVRWAAALAGLEGLKAPCGAATLAFADDALLAELNERFRGREGPTNVLSFAERDGGAQPGTEPGYLGDVVLARETVLREAAEQGKTALAHATHLAIHGLLHLLGEDHEDPAEAERMEALERRALARLGLPDPYAWGEEAPKTGR